MSLRFLFADADMFFVSVELALNPTLKGYPVMVGGYKGHGVISAASYEARQFGIHSGMSGYKAHLLCPNGIFLKGHYREYSSYSDRMFKIFQKYSPDVHVRSIDEGFIEISSCLNLFGGEEQLALTIKNEVKEKLKITISVGIASTITLAKMASEEGKPDGLTIIPEGGQQNYLQDLPIGRIPGIGKKTQQIFHKKGIFYIGNLYKYNTKEKLVNACGSFGNSLWYLLNGQSHYQKKTPSKRKSISNENTFYEALLDRTAVEKQVMRLSEKAGYRLRKKELKAKTVYVKIRYKDFSTITRRKTLGRYVESDKDIFQVAWSLVERNIKAPIRLIGVGLSSLQETEDLFSSLSKKDRDFYKALDVVREKYGRRKIYHGN